MGAAAHREAEKDFIQHDAADPKAASASLMPTRERLYKGGSAWNFFFSLPKILLSPWSLKAPGG